MVGSPFVGGIGGIVGENFLLKRWSQATFEFASAA
jgi:hypothetical protein